MDITRRAGVVLPALVVSLMFVESGRGDEQVFPPVSGPYLGQRPPGLIPELFAPFIAPPEDHKHSAPAFSSDGSEMYFSVYENYKFPQKIKRVRLLDGSWTAPQVASFSGLYQDGGPVFSPDGNRLFFYSKRPRGNDSVETEDADIWFVTRTSAGWSAASNPGAPINGVETNEYPMAFSPNGSLVIVRGSPGQPQMIVECTIDPETGLPVGEPRLYDGPQLDPDLITQGVCYSSAGDKIVVHSLNPSTREQGLWLSRREEDLTWSEMKSLGDMINRGGARFPQLSPDGKCFFFLSFREGPEEIFWVDASILDTALSCDLNLSARLAVPLEREGIDAARNLWADLEDRFANLYDFDHRLLGQIGDMFLSQGKTGGAAAAFELNQEMYPCMFGVFDQLKLAVAQRDSSAFRSAADVIPGEAEGSAGTMESQLNQLGYELLRGGLVVEAVRVFELNTLKFPRSGNAYDSYAEACLAQGDTARAIANYRTSLNLDSSNVKARNVLEQLGAKRSKPY